MWFNPFEGSSSGGTKNYSELEGKPSINNIELEGNKTWQDLGLSNPMHIVGRVDTFNDLPLVAEPGDVYLVGAISDENKAEYVKTESGWELIGSLNSTFELLADEYNSTLTYNLGDLVTYQGELYVCTTAIINPEAFNSKKWKSTNIASNLVGRKYGTKGEYFNSSNNRASGQDSHAEGYGTIASGDQSHSEGNSTGATGKYSHAEGWSTYATENSCHAEGTQTQALAFYSHAEGFRTKATKIASHAEGSNTIASAAHSHSQNLGTIAIGENQTALGSYNIADTTITNSKPQGTYAVIVGNGTDDNNRANAATLSWDGVLDLLGGIKINGKNLFEVLSKAEYDALENKTALFYFIKENIE